MGIVDACKCGLTPQVKEVDTVTYYFAVCECGEHGPAMPGRELAISEWNRQTGEGHEAEGSAGAAPSNGSDCSF